LPGTNPGQQGSATRAGLGFDLRVEEGVARCPLLAARVRRSGSRSRGSSVNDPGRCGIPGFTRPSLIVCLRK
jgi:hypothetical protein